MNDMVDEKTAPPGDTPPAPQVDSAPVVVTPPAPDKPAVVDMKALTDSIATLVAAGYDKDKLPSCPTTLKAWSDAVRAAPAKRTAAPVVEQALPKRAETAPATDSTSAPAWVNDFVTADGQGNPVYRYNFTARQGDFLVIESKET